MDKIKVCIIGAGNISNTRHIPALKQNKEVEIVGIISDDERKIERTLKNHTDLKGKETLIIQSTVDIFEQLSSCEWFNTKVDAVVIGTPPKQHYPVVKACLQLKKHVLVEKPMMMSVDESDEVLAISKEKQVVFYVMHSFQFSDGMIKLFDIYSKGELGKLKSILELQLTNRDRRLPVWYNDLPLGLYYDEAAHFFYGARRFGGELSVCNASAAFNSAGDNTPRFLQAQLMSGDIPVQMYMNFNSPICEWGLILIGENKIAIYDYFKDILIVLKNDELHLAKNVVSTSVSFFFQFWKGFLASGMKMISKKLLYGHDKCIDRFVRAIKGVEDTFELSAELGREVVRAMNEVVKNAKEEK